MELGTTIKLPLFFFIELGTTSTTVYESHKREMDHLIACKENTHCQSKILV